MRATRREVTHFGGMALASALLCRPGRSWAVPSNTIDPIDYLDPELRPIALRILAETSSAPSLSDATLVERRQKGAALTAAPLVEIAAVERSIDGLAGQPPVTVYIINAYHGASRPAILHIHGGGHVLGRAKWELRYLQELARDLDCIVVTVDYRLAPATRFAGSTADNYAALRWLHASADQLGVDRKRIALLGESAGGTHAALLAIAARDRGEIPIAFQALIYPMLDDRTGTTRQMPPFIGKVVWDATSNAYGWRSFLGVAPGSRDVPVRAIPARVENLTGLPPTFIAVGGADLFVDEDIDYARRLTDAGVPTELLVVPRAFHAFDRVAADTAIARRFTKAKMDAFRRAFAQTPVA